VTEQNQTVEIRVDGIVQGVGFRCTVQRLASRYDIHGWVANKPDGSVQMEATGTPEALDGFRQAIRDSHAGSGIDRWDETPHPVDKTVHGFHIRE
jgi:acylphosphatase